MPTFKALWKPLAVDDSFQRSSHGLAVHGGKAYAFGGELKPRTPVDAAVTVLDLAVASPRSLAPPSTASTAWPTSRVGHTFVSSDDGEIWCWGGRGGKDMSSFSDEGSIWVFDTETQSWEELKTKGDEPEPRSFHTMTALDNKLYLHAGCPASGRLSQLHCLDLSTLTWSSLPAAPEPGRGGTALTALPSAALGGKKLLARFGGFAGYELGGLDVFDVEKEEWAAVEPSVEGGGEGPAKRSVHVFVGLEGTLEVEGKRAVAVLAMGEREAAPKELGHDGAGFFHSDAWLLLASPPSSSDGSLPSFSWLRLDRSSASQGHPEACGWLASAPAGGNKVVLHGGLNEDNERLADGWVLEIVVE
ncbi:hypothetical protein JCM8097_000711 [Rhodosporidiobolus ruineniae]